MIRVMLVDDHEVVRKGLRAMLDDLGDMQVVAEAASESLLDPAVTARVQDRVRNPRGDVDPAGPSHAY